MRDSAEIKVRLNVVDKVVGYFDPVRGAKRQAARTVLAIRGYDGAKRGRKTDKWRTKGTSANVEVIYDLVMLRNRSRDLVRNNPWIKRAQNSWVANAIGEGITCEIKNNEQVKKLWVDWANSTDCDADGDLNLYGLQELAARTVWESGEVLIRFRWRRKSDKYKVPLQIQVLEADYLDSSKDGPLKNGNRIMGGKEYNKIGQLVAYYLFDNHPGDNKYYGQNESKRVDAEYISHVFKKTRPQQNRGVPELAPVIVKTRDLDSYDDAELTRKTLEACLSMIITKDDDSSPDTTLGESSTDENGRTVETMSPGMIARLPLGQDVKFGQPTASNGYPEYTKTQHRAIAAGVGVTYEQLTGDYSQVNYSSSRAALLEFKKNVKMWQWNTFVPKFCRPVAKAFFQALELTEVSVGDIHVEWTAPRWEWVDPVKDIKGDLMEVAAGVKSLSELTRERGYNPDQVRKELAEDYKALADAGIPINLAGLIQLIQAVGDETEEPKRKSDSND